ncbi:uncharacterized protein EDB91DRAFT_1090005 [Suillus paluster]|uniref:uncharacterized protein n=1 Tax=Suillus paluster TaxID=48578 RepID=UPI001B87BAEE|nr:uncharacterized protein EDB91DRAFT_1090005 [Suillus paluster]KAG1718528.1 hypothetical protein EDB91DRAFT_1090005 [Suillus paluster]
MSKYCEFPDCEGGPYTNEEARKHKWRYHSFPASFIIGGREYIVAQSDTHYACPLPGCDKELRKRDDMQKHVIADHNGGVSIKVFDTRDTPMDQDRDVSAQALVPGTPSPQGIIPTVDDGSPVDSDTVKLLPSVDYLKSNEALDALGVCVACGAENTDMLYVPSAIDLWDGGRSQKETSTFVRGMCLLQLFNRLSWLSAPKPRFTKNPRLANHAKALQGEAQDGALSKRSTSSMPRSIGFSLGSEAHIFEISNDLLPGARPQLKDRLKETFLPGLDAPLVVPADTERERTPLVRCMAWDTFMTENRMNPAQRRAAQEIKKQHADKEHDGILTLTR